MVKLSEMQRIEILMMIGYGDRMRTQIEVCQLFNHKYPDQQISQSTVSRVEQKFRNVGHVRDLPRSGRPNHSEETRLNILLSVEDNPRNSTELLGLDNNVGAF